MSGFSHIYVEEKAFSYPETQHILERFPRSRVIPVTRYLDVYARPRQDQAFQRKNRALILAVKEGHFLYPGPAVCQDFGQGEFLYTSSVINCLFDCSYCFLKGFAPSAHPVVFVNLGDFFEAARERLKQGKVALSASYETDLCAFAPFVDHAKRWMDFSRNEPGLTLELRTKTGAFPKGFLDRPSPQTILAFSFLPDEAIRRYEPKTPSLSRRIDAARDAADHGHRLRFCIDPVLPLSEGENPYVGLIETLGKNFRPGEVESGSLGFFRMGRDFFQRMKQRFPESVFLFQNMEYEAGETVLPADFRRQMQRTIRKAWEKVFPASPLVEIEPTRSCE